MCSIDAIDGSIPLSKHLSEWVRDRGFAGKNREFALEGGELDLGALHAERAHLFLFEDYRLLSCVAN